MIIPIFLGGDVDFGPMSDSLVVHFLCVLLGILIPITHFMVSTLIIIPLILLLIYISIKITITFMGLMSAEKITTSIIATLIFGIAFICFGLYYINDVAIPLFTSHIYDSEHLIVPFFFSGIIATVGPFIVSEIFPIEQVN